MASLDGGDIVIAVLGGFFKCPPAPYETAFMLHDLLTRRGVREACTISLLTPMPKPVPISDEVSNAILGLCDERDIRHSHATWVEQLDPEKRVARLRDGRAQPLRLVAWCPRTPSSACGRGLGADRRRVGRR